MADRTLTWPSRLCHNPHGTILMKLLVSHTPTLNGTVRIPGSKSHTIRSVVLASLAEGTSHIIAPLVSNDTLSAMAAYRALGATIEVGQDRHQQSEWVVKGVAGRPTAPETIIDVGNSGTTLRLAAASAALMEHDSAVFTGDKQIRSRPIEPLIRSLNDLGAHCYCTRNNGRVPIVIHGPLVGGETKLKAVTSQYLSALLLAAPFAPRPTRLEVLELNERPYVEMTLRYLDELGLDYHGAEDMSHFEIPGMQRCKAFKKRVPADFSSATFFFCAAAILDSQLTLEGLDLSDSQGDKAIVGFLREMGVSIEIDPATSTDSPTQTVHVKRAELHGIEADLNATPDMLPALAVVACFADSPSRFYNVEQARLKETDRIAVMKQELSKLGAHVTEHQDGLTIKPGKLHPADLEGHDDHRVVMALSLAAMALPERCRIDSAEAVSVTFPDFVPLMQGLGACMELSTTE